MDTQRSGVPVAAVAVVLLAAQFALAALLTTDILRPWTTSVVAKLPAPVARWAES